MAVSHEDTSEVLQPTAENSSVEDAKAEKSLESISLKEDSSTEESLSAGGEFEESLEEESESPTWDPDEMKSLIEAGLFAAERPLSIYALKAFFPDPQPSAAQLRKCIRELSEEYVTNPVRAFEVVDVAGSYQLRTKRQHLEALKRNLKPRSVRLSPPAMEVLALVAYRQPITKGEIDATRGVESGHLLRILIEKSLVTFGGKSDLPGKPMQYISTRKFLESFSLRNLEELPTLEQIKELLPEGIDSSIEEKDTWDDIQEQSPSVATESYSVMTDAADIIADQLSQIETMGDYLREQEEKKKKDAEERKATGIRSKLASGEVVSPEDERWLARYDKKLQKVESIILSETEISVSPPETNLT